MGYQIAYTLLTSLLFFSLSSCTSPGEKLFSKHGCINCHSFEGKGKKDGVGSDLTDVRNRRTDGWIRAQLDNPKLHNPFSQMPSFANLSEEEKEAIIKYITKK